MEDIYEETRLKVKKMEYIHSLLEGYKNNPSNSNKYYQAINAIVFDDDWIGMEPEDD